MHSGVVITTKITSPNYLLSTSDGYPYFLLTDYIIVNKNIIFLSAAQSGLLFDTSFFTIFMLKYFGITYVLILQP